MFPFLNRFYYCVIICDHRINCIQGYLIILTYFDNKGTIVQNMERILSPKLMLVKPYDTILFHILPLKIAKLC